MTGFYRPPAGPGVVGYTGPAIAATEIRPEPSGPPRESTRRDSWVHENPERPGMAFALCPQSRDKVSPRINHLAFSGTLAEDTRIVAALRGVGGQNTGFEAARVSQLVLATLLHEPAYAPLLGTPVEPEPIWLNDLSGWVSWVLDRSPLPQEPAELLRALALRIAEALDELNLRMGAMTAYGVLVHLRRRRAILHGLGVCRAYVIGREGSRLVVPECTMRTDAQARGIDFPDDYPHAWVPYSFFDLKPGVLQAACCAEVELQPGERLLLVVGEALLKALDGPASVARLVAAFPEIAAKFPETPEMPELGWGAVVVDP